MTRHSRDSGFTLLEILLVVAAIAILAGIVIVAINPGRQLADTRNAQRKVDTRTIASAISQYRLRVGTVPDTLDAGDYCGQSGSQEICATDASSCSGLTDLSVLTDDSAYLVAIPMDPSGSGDENGTGYYAMLDANNRVVVCAGQAELDETISVTQ